MLLALLSELAKVTRPKFASFTYRNAEGELSRYTIMLGLSYRNVCERDRATLLDLLPSLDGLHKDAAEELLKSVEDTLRLGAGNNPRYTHGAEQGDTYVSVKGIDDVKVHKVTGELYVSGYVHSKVVLEAVEYPHVNSRPKTIAKRSVKKHLRSDKYRQFALGNIQSARLNGETLELA